MFHFFLFGLILLTIACSCVNLVKSIGDPPRMWGAVLFLSLSIIGLFLFFFCRTFALKAQDRAIRAEETLRHFVLTGKLLDSTLTIRQIIGLRFASDDEFASLAHRAAIENLSEDAIKKAIKNWRGDYYRA